MQDITLICTVDGAEYKEYEVLINDEPLLFLEKMNVTHRRLLVYNRKRW